MSNQLSFNTKEISIEAIIINDNSSFPVDARKLHTFLSVKSRFNDWIINNLEFAQAIENTDFKPDTKKIVTASGTKKTKEYYLTLDVAKNLAMLARTNKGKIARSYFIEIEKKFLSIKLDSYLIEDKIERAERWIEEQKETKLLEQDNKEKELLLIEQKPKVDYYNTVATSKNGVTVKEASKILNMILPSTGKTIGETHLFALLRERGVLRTNNEPYQKYIDNGYFRLKQGVYTRKHRDGTTSNVSYTQALLYPKGINQIRKMLLKLGYEIKEEYLEKKNINKKVSKTKKYVKLGE